LRGGDVRPEIKDEKFQTLKRNLIISHRKHRKHGKVEEHRDESKPNRFPKPVRFIQTKNPKKPTIVLSG